jgi:hypothetical protein
MSQGHYSVIRCIPDPARGELFNLGVAVWSAGRFNVQVDSDAAARAARENPSLAVDAFSHLERAIYTRLLELDPINTTKFKRLRKNHRGTTFLYGEPQFVNVPAEGIDPLAVVLDRLMARMVKARRAQAREAEPMNPVEELAGRILGLITFHKVIRRHHLDGGKTRTERQVDFFVPSKTAGVAVDVLRLDVKEEEAAMRRADAEAFKIYDVMDSSQVGRFYVLPFGEQAEDEHELVESPIHRAIRSVRGEILRDFAEAEAVIREAAEAA